MAHGGLVETTLYRYKTIIGRRLHARSLTHQRTEVNIARNAPNRMTGLDMPIKVLIKYDRKLKRYETQQSSCNAPLYRLQITEVHQCPPDGVKGRTVV
jgi:hypothetical protein